MSFIEHTVAKVPKFTVSAASEAQGGRVLREFFTGGQKSTAGRKCGLEDRPFRGIRGHAPPSPQENFEIVDCQRCNFMHSGSNVLYLST